MAGIIYLLFRVSFYVRRYEFGKRYGCLVDHWNYENIDIYVMNDTITYSSDSNGRGFSVSTKFVKNGQLKQIVVWNFSKFRNDMWRYRTNTMRGGHTTVVIPHNGVFEYGMNQIGWRYYIDQTYYY